jgi:replication fork clamp-binding protein CrfC
MFLPPQCDRLADNVNQILDLLPASLIDRQSIRVVEASLAKVIAPKFEIVFAGAFSAGKSMLINALLERELLYSAEGHATGTECYIEYAEADAERVVLTFLSEAEIERQAISLCQYLGLSAKVEYYCHHPLLQDGNVLVDMPGIDAPVKQDAELTYSKVEHPDTSAVICVLKAASAGEMTSEETKLLETMKSHLGIRDRVFYVFNRIDSIWFAAQLRQRLEDLIATQFRDTQRVYKTSGLLGFYGSQIKSIPAF